MSKFNLLMGILLTLVVILLLDSLVQFYFGIRPIKTVSTITPDAPYESVTFQTTDKLRIHGWFIPNQNPKAPAIIIMHGYPADKGNIMPSTLFPRKDFNLLYFDFRYFGNSEGHYSTLGKDEVTDLLAAVEFLQHRGIQKIGVWGYSLGGVVALMASPRSPAIRAIVAQAPYARLDWIVEAHYPIPGLNNILSLLTRFWAALFLNYDISRVNPVDVIKNIAVPTLIIHSKTDHLITLKHIRAFQEAAQNNAHIQLLIVNNVFHGEHFQGYDQTIASFFKKHLY